MRIFADYHTHTVHSHGRGTVEENALAALECGLRELAITDHGPAHIGIGIPELGTLGLIRAETRQYTRQLPGLSVLAGVEANIVDVDGTLDVPAADLRKLDIVLAGLHWQVWPRSLAAAGMFLGNLVWRGGGGAAGRRLRNLNTKAAVDAVRRHDIDIFTHPGLRANLDTAELARACAARATAMEVSAAHAFMTPEYVCTCLRAGADLVLSSDAHRPERVGDVAAAVRLVEAAGAPPERILNAACGDRESAAPRRIRWGRPRHESGR
jgi:putative hydrolase